MNREKLTYQKKLISKNTMLLILSGMLNREQADELGSLIQQLNQGGYQRIILNMSQIAYINSMALRTMIKIFRQTQKDETTLIFTELSPQVEEIFRFTNLMRIFTIVEREEDATRLS